MKKQKQKTHNTLHLKGRAARGKNVGRPGEPPIVVSVLGDGRVTVDIDFVGIGRARMGLARETATALAQRLREAVAMIDTVEEARQVAAVQAEIASVP